MRFILSSILLCISFTLFAQKFSGNYKSDFTSFKDETNANYKFKEASVFNISISFENNNSGVVIVKDPRIPNKVLSYEVTEFLNKVENNSNTLYIYKAMTTHLQDPIDTKIILYYNKNLEFHLMIYDMEGSQVFHNLIKF